MDWNAFIAFVLKQACHSYNEIRVQTSVDTIIIDDDTQ